MFAFSMKRLQSRKNRKTLEMNMCIRTGLTASVSPLARARKIMALVGVVPAKLLICPACRCYMQMWNIAETICKYAIVSCLLRSCFLGLCDRNQVILKRFHYVR